MASPAPVYTNKGETLLISTATMEEIIPKGTYLPYSYYANDVVSDDRCILIPSWVAGGIFPLVDENGTNGSKSSQTAPQKRRKRNQNDPNGIRQFRRSKLEQLVYKEIRNCDVCSRSILWTSQLQQSYFGQSDDDEATPSIASCLPHFMENHVQSQSAIPCSFCHQAHAFSGDTKRRSWCGALFCSAVCQQKGERSSGTLQSSAETGDRKVSSATAPFPLPKVFFCRNRISSCVSANQKGENRIDGQEVLDSIGAIEQRLRSICRPYHDSDSLIGVEECALLMVTLISCSCRWWANELLQLSSKIKSANQVGSAKRNASSSGNLEPSEEGLVEEMWVMSHSYWSLVQSSKSETECEPNNEATAADANTHSANNSTKPSDSPSFLSYPEFVKLYVFIKRHSLVRVSPSPHPLVSAEETNSQNHNNQEPFADSSQGSIQSLITLWRRTTHFAHWMSTHSSEEHNQNNQKRIYSWLHKSYYAFSPVAWSTVKHSCVPTLLMVMNDLGGKTVSSKGDDNSKNNVSWLALHDIPNGEASVSKIDSLDVDANSRQVELKRLMGRDFVCTCERCWYELQNCSSEKVHTSSLSTKQLKRLGDVAMQQGRFEDATTIYQAILDVDPLNADAFHAKAASFLGRASSTNFSTIGHFLQAQHLWSEAASNDNLAKHPDISVHLVKQEAFGTIQDLQCVQDVLSASSSSIHCSSFLDDKVFLTNDNTPIITLAECQTVIQAAEDYAKKTGWTTSRHYAVPTTDIPLHELKSLVSWFRCCWDKRIRPLLRHQFKLTTDKPSSTRRDIFIHDAFVVRYDAEGGQRNLPPHYDESTHSFIIALNTNYEGGGTYIHRLGRALKPGAAGGMISFCGGELLHSGDTVVKGVRFIIVAFCYVDLITRSEDNQFETKKEGKHSAQAPDNSQPFSFGFSF